MGYTRARSDWLDFPNTTTPLRGEDLDHIEDGLVTAAATADMALASIKGYTGGIVWTIDDIRAQNVDLIALHEARSQRVALGVVSDWVGDADRLTSAQLLGYHQAGHELVNHSNTHASYTGLTATQRATETDTCSNFIETLTGIHPKTFFYPSGAWSATTDQELYGRFRSWGVTISDLVTFPSYIMFGDTFHRFYRLDIDDPDNFERAKSLIRQASMGPIIVSFYTHWTDQPGTLTTAQYTELIDLAHNLGVVSFLPREVFGNGSMLADASFEDGGENWIESVTGDGVTSVEIDTPASGIYGTKVIELSATGPGTALRYQAIMVDPSIVTYKISGRVRIVAGTYNTADARIRIRWRTADEAAISTSNVDPVLPGVVGTWARFEGDVTVPATARYGYFDIISAPGAVRTATIQWDHIDIRPANYAGLG